jgi:hypothetical protein
MIEIGPNLTNVLYTLLIAIIVLGLLYILNKD